MNGNTTGPERKKTTAQEKKPPPQGTAPSQHDLMRKDLPKESVADALDDFDGDEA